MWFMLINGFLQTLPLFGGVTTAAVRVVRRPSYNVYGGRGTRV